ncbi:MAG: type 4a pilus biogenesis protein PilO [Firmicutes bacterium]|nr:type 4a pilus biogenesis protein PilO [Bacillota bacterium]
MNKLGNKEVILILIVINFMLYYMLYFIGISPLKNSINNNKADIATLQEEYDEKKAIVDSEETYKQSIERLKAEKVELFATGFPNTNAESLHAFINKEATASNINISSINITQAPRLANGDQETGIMDNNISVSATGSYASITKLLSSIEEVQKTSLLTGLSLSGAASDMQTQLQYSFLSADKEDIPDDVFDHTFGQPAGNTTLFK